MHLEDLKEAMAELRSDGEASPENTLTMLMAKVGQMAEGTLKLDAATEEQVDDEAEAEHRRDLLAGTIVACVEYAAEHDIDIEQAVDERLERMREMKKQQEAIEEAVENGDAQALAEALGADGDGQEVPTEMFEDDEDEDLRYIG